MRRLPLALLVLLLAGCGSSTSPSESVTYRVTGNGPASLITYEMPAGAAQRSDVFLPWSQSRSAGSGDFLYVSAQRGLSDSGCISVAIVKGSSTIASNQSCGAFVIATASGSY